MIEPELFHAINDGGESARARQAVLDLGLTEKIRFRNLFYPEVQRDFHQHGGTRTPALWDGEKLHEGADAVLAFLRAMTDV